MDAATVTALGALLASLVTGAAAAYGSRGATRTAREGGALDGYSSLTDQLQEERTELRSDVAALRAELAAEKAETTRLRMLVAQLGGTP